MIGEYKWIVALGDLDCGFSFYGTYDSWEEAEAAMVNDPTVEEGCTYTIHSLAKEYTKETWAAAVAAHEARQALEGESEDD
jgi:hypothetical protein